MGDGAQLPASATWGRIRLKRQARRARRFLIAPGLKIGLGALRQEHQPRALEIGAGLLEGRSGVGLMFAWMRTRIETAAPFPWISIVRIADALGNRSDRNIAVVNVPAFIAVVYGSAAGEGGHATLKRGTWRKATRLQLGTNKCAPFIVLLEPER